MAVQKKTKYRKCTEGRVYINFSFNNTLISVTDVGGDALCQYSAGRDYRGARKSTPFAAQQAAEAVGKRAVNDYGMKRAMVILKGPGSGRDSAVRALRAAGLEITCLEDQTRIPHNGCRRRKKRRV